MAVKRYGGIPGESANFGLVSIEHHRDLPKRHESGKHTRRVWPPIVCQSISVGAQNYSDLMEARGPLTSAS